MSNFFIYEALIIEQQLDITGFELYSPGHLIWLAAIVIVSIIASISYRRSSGQERDRTRRFFALAILIAEICKDLILAMAGAPMIKYLPLHLCSYAIICMLAEAFCRRREWRDLAGQMMAYAFFPGAVAALLFCNWTIYPFFTFMNIFSFVFHGWIVIYFVMLYRAGEVRPDYKGLWKTALVIGIIAIPVYIFNHIFETNYLFLNEAQEGSPLVAVWNIFGTRFGQAGYLAGVVLLVVVIFHILYLVYMVMDKIKTRKDH